MDIKRHFSFEMRLKFVHTYKECENIMKGRCRNEIIIEVMCGGHTREGRSEDVRRMQ